MNGGIALTVAFPKPGFFLDDCRLTVWLNGHPIYDGSFRSGFETTFPVQPGTHALGVRLTTPIFNREKNYAVTVDVANGYRVELEYSRLWGNFTGSPRITRW